MLSILDFLMIALPFLLGAVCFIAKPKVTVGNKTKLTFAGYTVIILSICLASLSILQFKNNENEKKREKEENWYIRKRLQDTADASAQKIDRIENKLNTGFGIIFNSKREEFAIADMGKYRSRINDITLDTPTVPVKSTILDQTQPQRTVVPDHQRSVTPKQDIPSKKATRYAPVYDAGLLRQRSPTIVDGQGRCIFINSTGRSLKLYFVDNRVSAGGSLALKINITDGDQEQTPPLFLGYGADRDSALGLIGDCTFYFVTTGGGTTEYGSYHVNVKAGYEHKIELTRENTDLSAKGDKLVNFL